MRKITGALLASGVMAGGSIATETASAQQPPGCSVFPNSDGWDANCTIGPGFDTSNNMVAAIQDVITYENINHYTGSPSCGTRDGLYGNNTYYCVRSFQGHHNLSVDGVVGAGTWKTLRNMTPYLGQWSGLHFYETWNQQPGVNFEGDEFFRPASGSYLNYWFIVTRKGCAHLSPMSYVAHTVQSPSGPPCP